MLVASRASTPAIASRTSPQSSAVSAIGPSLSSRQQSATAPCGLTRPWGGRTPVILQYAAGRGTDPPVSEPIANGTQPAPTAEPEPLDEPPLHASGAHGEIPGPVNDAFGW